MAQSAAKMEAWNEAVGAAMEAVGTPQFPRRLEAALSALVTYDICMVFAYRGRRRPMALHDNMERGIAAVVVDDYLAGPYLLDPFFGAVTKGKDSGFATLRDLAPDRFYQSEYYRRHYIRTGIREEAGFFVGLPVGSTAVISITRQQGRPGFTRGDLLSLKHAAPVVRALGAAHWGPLDRALPDTWGNGSAHDAIESALESVGQDVLTSREAEVVSLILKGHSSESIARNLQISRGTVKIHRKNAYHKLEISSQAELFSMFIAALRRSIREPEESRRTGHRSLNKFPA